ncbi:integrase/recombinase XerD [Parabacteroides sp. PF5-5]|uniref:tyrosine-type recombinase/integrase n=1 Tax=unclassified Parabacteroides TaxID=2649774 RepID=UPI0024760D7D|nr:MULTISPECIES: tyrosine-type recombinase/integrase [unclassified Parabacteroides]MDH6306386.1 integrase/recombinase XerD [Parabacteroides sp. PH5-39]MDH6314658.1 integrase/recombinase XerD [Parabacteroides sp. PF5-13]MDH6321097.1 integrase/recombinase XerD [Parabacteroides sp. PH5-13]MDH6324829.1 integrase/recombinase XerD [Parabacteroides sp. PH5-8]MDH6325490.1 integrase/recombinase XerD [Parabacteroides sp. PH5-41]
MNTRSLQESVSEMNVSEVIKGFLFHCQFEKNLSSKTLRAYTTDLKQFAAYIKGTEDEKRFKSMTKDTLKSYLQKISHLKPKTIKRKVASLKAMLNYLEYEDDDYINPFRKIKVRLKEPSLIPSVMTLHEVKKILSIMYKELENNSNVDRYTYKALVRNIAIVEILFSTGMRVSEVCNLQLQDINLKNGIIKVFGKGSKERMIQICQSETISIIKNYYQLHRTQIKDGTFFFVNRLGLPLSTQSVRLMVKSYVNRAGLTKHITPHTFRHTFATLLLEEDVDIKYIQNMLGHSSIAITQIYTHVNMNKQKKILTTKHPRRKLQLAGNG